MKMTLKIECECGNHASFDLKKERENYSSIRGGVSENPLFLAVRYSPDVVMFTCKICGREHDLYM